MTDFCTLHGCVECDPKIKNELPDRCPEGNYIAVRFGHYESVDWSRYDVTLDGQVVTNDVTEAHIAERGFVVRYARHEDGLLWPHADEETVKNGGWVRYDAGANCLSHSAICQEIVYGDVRLVEKAGVGDA